MKSSGYGIGEDSEAEFYPYNQPHINSGGQSCPSMFLK